MVLFLKQPAPSWLLAREREGARQNRLIDRLTRERERERERERGREREKTR